MQSRFLESIRKLGFSDNEKPILVAASGGVDSMVLASLLLENGFSVSLVHCNYQIRGADSDADEALVKNWCQERNIPFYLKQVQTKRLVEESNSSIQMVAREARYSFFEELMNEHGYAATALAHHANDRVESLLMNVLRGTGFRGFSGMPSKRVNYIRPLIGFKKEQIREYAEMNSVPFREDTSNEKTDYQRNWVRLRVLPMLEAHDSNSFDDLLRFCERAEAALPDYERLIRHQLNKVSNSENVSIDQLQDSKIPFTLLKELLEPKGFSSNHIFEVMEILDSNSGAEILSETHRVLKDRGQLLISEFEVNEKPPVLQFETLNKADLKSLKTESNVALIDAAKLEELELKFRKWQQGDKFKPLGMKGWKLLSDFFIDQKFSIPQKEQIWLLTYRDEIVWVIGMRLDDRFKITDSTQNVLRVRY